MTAIRMNQFIRGAFLLTLIGFISKLLSAFYRIPIQNVTGDLGFYTYQQVYPFIATVMILSLYSFPSAIAKIGAQIGERNRTFNRFILPNFFILFMINGALFLIVYMSAPFIATLSGNTALQTTYEMIAFAFLIIPFLSISRGFFQSGGDMKQTAYSQLIEQLIRVAIIIFACFLIFSGRLEVLQIGYYGSIASIVSMIVAVFVLMILYFKKKNQHHLSASIDQPPWKTYIKTVLVFGLVFSLNHMIFIIIQFADVLTLIPTLIKFGLTSEHAMVTKGIYDRAIPLIQLGVVIGSSFAIALIPVMSAYKTLKEKTVTIQHALSLCLYLSIGATVGLIVLFPEVNLLLFKSIDETVSLRLFSVSIMLLAIMMTINPILQTTGKHWHTIIYAMMAFVVKIILNMLFVPLLGLVGASLATIISVALLVIVQMYQLYKVFPNNALLINLKWKAFGLATIVMVLYLSIWKFVVKFTMIPRTWLLVYVLFLVVSGASIYFLILLKNHAFTEKQLRALPFSTWLLIFTNKIEKSND